VDAAGPAVPTGAAYARPAALRMIWFMSAGPAAVDLLPPSNDGVPAGGSGNQPLHGRLDRLGVGLAVVSHEAGEVHELEGGGGVEVRVASPCGGVELGPCQALPELLDCGRAAVRLGFGESSLGVGHGRPLLLLQVLGGPLVVLGPLFPLAGFGLPVGGVRRRPGPAGRQRRSGRSSAVVLVSLVMSAPVRDWRSPVQVLAAQKGGRSVDVAVRAAGARSLRPGRRPTGRSPRA
jgi:hypothetical protein